jgi:glycosyltransferase involved in cell wall biosynthesis
MKIVLYVCNNEWPHRKNLEAIQRMCSVCNIEFEVSHTLERLQEDNYDLLLSCNTYVEPSLIPKKIKILFGPHFFIFPSNSIVGERNDELSRRCAYNVLSNWNKQVFHEIASNFTMPLVTLPFGVDTNRFSPYNMDYEKIFDCVLYIKHRSKAHIQYVLNLLVEKHINCHVFEYGSYKEEDYLYGIRMSKFMLVLDAHESQGFALEEAMSCNVPLLVMDATSMYDETNDGIHSTYDYLKPKELLASSVPYWSDECGIRIHDFEKLNDAIDSMMINYMNFTPRKYVLRTLSDEQCMKRFLDYFNIKKED